MRTDRWWVNAPGAVPAPYATKAQARAVAYSVRGATVSRRPKRGGRHTNSDKGFGAKPWWMFW